MLKLVDSLFRHYFTIVYSRGRMGAEGAVFLLMALLGLNIFAALIFIWIFLVGRNIHAIWPTLILLIIFYSLNWVFKRRYIVTKNYMTMERADIVVSVTVLILHWIITLGLFLKFVL